eukprot:TRINITY_DN14367_c0_g1_i1.p1 TRINITY_DN14367_c0_g1~~TRINITY_DN14367_c0_g1_i1.p1  ORF type:complete len:559 (+),score=96.34 TRINITY_DN14367_c0_g1_i1:33-1709(+)
MAAKRDDAYSVLGVGHGSSDVDIRSAYRRRALETHPDKGGTAEAFRRVVEAFETLSDVSRRTGDEQSECTETRRNDTSAQEPRTQKRHVPKSGNDVPGGRAKRGRWKDRAQDVFSKSASPSTPPTMSSNKPTPTTAPSEDAKENPNVKSISAARVITDLLFSASKFWTERLRQLSDATLLEVVALLQTGTTPNIDADSEDETKGDRVAEDTTSSDEGVSAMLALEWSEGADVRGDASGSDTAFLNFEDDFVEGGHPFVGDARTIVGEAAEGPSVAPAEAFHAKAAGVCPDAATASKATSPLPSRRPPPRRKNMRGVSKHRDAFIAAVGVKGIMIVTHACHDLDTAIDFHIDLVRLRRMVITRMKQGDDFQKAMLDVHAHVIAERHHSKKSNMKLSYSIRVTQTGSGTLGEGTGNRSGRCCKRTQDLREAMKVWGIFRGEIHRQRDAQKRGRLEKCARLILRSRTRIRGASLFRRWGVRELPKDVETTSLHEIDDSICAVLRLSDGSVQRGPPRLCLQEAEVDAVELSSLQKRRGDAAACAELERREVAAMTALFMQSA